MQYKMSEFGALRDEVLKYFSVLNISSDMLNYVLVYCIHLLSRHTNMHWRSTIENVLSTATKHNIVHVYSYMEFKFVIGVSATLNTNAALQTMTTGNKQ